MRDLRHMVAARWRYGLAVGLAAFTASGATMLLNRTKNSSAPLQEGVFVWQLGRDDGVSAAIRQEREIFSEFHVLIGEFHRDGAFRPAQLSWPGIIDAAGGHRIVPVVRINANFSAQAPRDLAARVGAIFAAVPPSARGAVEIDADYPTRLLGAYAAFMAGLRPSLPPGTRILATALPAWSGSAEFRQLEQEVDRFILQVHALDDPRLGLFDSARAARQIEKFSDVASKSFAVALPAYGVRVIDGGAGTPFAVEGEMALMAGGAGHEVVADPALVASLVVQLRNSHPPLLDGLLWFRLPVAGDRRAWSAATLRRVIAGTYRPRPADIITRPAHTPDAKDIFVVNRGDDDILLVTKIPLPPGCDMADGAPPYQFQDAALVARYEMLLPAHMMIRAGWMRCQGGTHG